MTQELTARESPHIRTMRVIPVAGRDSMLLNLTQQLKVERKRHPSWFRRTVGRAVVFTAGVVAGRLLPH